MSSSCLKNPRELEKYIGRRQALNANAAPSEAPTGPTAAQLDADLDLYLNDDYGAMPSADLPGMMMQSAGFSRPSANLPGMASQSTGFVRRPPPVPAREPSAPSADTLNALRAPSIAHMNVAPGFMRQARAVPPQPMLQPQQQEQRLSPPSSDADSLSLLQIDSVSAYSNVTPGFVRAPSSNYDGMMSQSAGYVPSANLAGMSMQQPGRVPMPSSNYAGMSMQPAGAPVPVARVNKLPQRAAPTQEPSTEELYAATVSHSTRTAVEIELELKRLFGVVQAGFIADQEYSRRKKALEAELRVAARPLAVPVRRAAAPLASDADSAAGPRRERSVRVFLSSTFVDMGKERDALVKHAFQELRKTCAERAIAFSEVDLRWGITQQQAERGEVIGLCLSEIDNCRPYFINILGNRYGWVPPVIPPELRLRYPWLPDTRKGPNDKSVTEFEVMHGALNDLSSVSNALFYTLNEDLCDPTKSDNPGKLKALKQQIRDANLPVRVYSTPEDLAAMVLEDLQSAIDRDFPRSQDPDEAKLEDQAHLTLEESLSRVYAEEAAEFDALDKYVEGGDATPVVVTGESGSGKSALLANWARRFRAQQQGGSGALLVHYVSASAEASSQLALCRRIVAALKTETGFEEEVPADTREVAREFGTWLGRATAAAGIDSGRRLVIVLDGLDQLTDADGARELRWLPDRIAHPTDPSAVSPIRMIVSAASGSTAAAALAKRKWRNVVTQSGVTAKRKAAIATRYLKQFGKSLDERQLQQVVAATQTSSPLYMRVLLEELRVHGSFEQLNATIARYLEARSVSALFDLFLDRLEREHTVDRVRAFGLSLLLSRRGLAEEELQLALGCSRLAFTPLYLAMRENLASRQGLLTFAHAHLREAVAKRYKSGEAEQRVRLIAYWQSASGAERAKGARQADELPLLLIAAGEWTELVRTLTTPAVFLALYNKRRKFELIALWRDALAHSGVDLGTAHLNALNLYKRGNPTNQELASLVGKLARFLREMQKYEVAEKLFLMALTLTESVFGDLSKQSAKINYMLAECFWNQSKMNEARPYCERSLEIRERVLGGHHLEVAMSLCGLGETWMEVDDAKAKPLIERALAIRISHFGEGHPLVARCYQDLAVIADNAGQTEEAIELCKKAISVRERTLGPLHPHLASSFEALASIYKLAGRPREAEEAIRRALKIYTTVYGEEHSSSMASMEWLVLILRDLDPNSAEARAVEQKAKAINDKLTAQNVHLVGERIAD